MKRIAFLGALLASSMAFAQITNSKHDFFNSTTAHATDGQVCKYCHTPHKAATTRAIWNHALTTVAAYNYGADTVTVAGTALRTTFNSAQSSLLCLSCHDGTVALGDLTNVGGGTDGANLTFTGTSVAGNGTLTGADLLTTGGTNLSGNHPIGVPYATQTYYGTVSCETIGAGHYFNQSNGITQPTNGLQLTLARQGATTNYGVECATCHDPHGTANLYMLKGTLTGSALCLSCHNK